ncbi:MAG: hypothetical protein ABIY55_25225, partial [Kofleriaceae bacterium]
MGFVFHVYVEGVTGTAPDAVRTLSDAMAERYGLPAGELYARLAKGRFRVKANVDQTTADTYARDLEAIGARVRIEPAQGTDSSPVASPRGASPSTSPAVTARGTTPSSSPVRTSPAIVRRTLGTPTTGSPPTAAGSLSASPPEGSRPRQPLPPQSLPPQSSTSPSALSALPPEGSRPRQPLTSQSLPPQPSASPPALPPQVSRPTPSALPPQVSRPTLSALPPQPSASSSPSTVSALPPAQPRSRPQLSSLPPAPELRPALPATSAAFVGDDELAIDDVGSLGALDGSGLLSLSSLDGGPSEPAPTTGSAFAASAPPASGPGPASP